MATQILGDRGTPILNLTVLEVNKLVRDFESGCRVRPERLELKIEREDHPVLRDIYDGYKVGHLLFLETTLSPGSKIIANTTTKEVRLYYRYNQG
jgi:hypothetical protein